MLCSFLTVNPVAGSARGLLGQTILKSTVAAFEKWATRHAMTFNSTERPKRLKIFGENLSKIRLVNLQRRSYTLKLNKFAHLTFEEFKSKYLRYRPSNQTVAERALQPERVLKSSPTGTPRRQIPAAINWRKRGAVTFVKDQGSCGKSVCGSVKDCSKQCPHLTHQTDDLLLVSCKLTSISLLVSASYMPAWHVSVFEGCVSVFVTDSDPGRLALLKKHKRFYQQRTPLPSGPTHTWLNIADD